MVVQVRRPLRTDSNSISCCEFHIPRGPSVDSRLEIQGGSRHGGPFIKLPDFQSPPALRDLPPAQRRNPSGLLELQLVVEINPAFAAAGLGFDLPPLENIVT